MARKKIDRLKLCREELQNLGSFEREEYDPVMRVTRIYVKNTLQPMIYKDGDYVMPQVYERLVAEHQVKEAAKRNPTPEAVDSL